LAVTDLAVSYGLVEAVRQATLEVWPGELVALVGANGAGKTTLLETILGITRPRSGDIRFRGRDITRTPTEKIVSRGLALVPEGRGILPQMSVRENLLLGAYHKRREIETSLDHVLTLFPILKERMKQTAGTMSGGQQQMLSIGRALMARPKLLMLDEPSLGLAPLVVNEIFRVVAELADSGYSVILAEQNARKALQVAGKGYVFETGRVVLSGDPAELMADEAVAAAYLGGVAERGRR
jgi:branched-chain amino acid transport system ATP-binding protein